MLLELKFFLTKEILLLFSSKNCSMLRQVLKFKSILEWLAKTFIIQRQLSCFRLAILQS